MIRAFLLFRHHDLHRCDYLLLDDALHCISRADDCELASLELPAHDELIVVIPADTVRIATTQLPIKKTQQLRQAIPFALEDELLTDLDDVHIAIIEAKPQQQTMHLMSKAYLQTVLHRLAEVGLTPDKLYSEMNLLKPLNKTWQCYVHDDVALLALSDKILSCDRENIAVIFEQALHSQKELPQQFFIHDFTPNKKAFAFPAMLNDMVMRQAHDASDWSLFLSDNLAKEMPVDLLQGEFSSHNVQKHWRYYRRGVYALASICLALWLLMPALSHVALKAQLNKWEQRKTVLYQQVFPNAQASSMSRQRVAHTLRRYRQEVSGDEFLTLLSYFAPIAQQHHMRILSVNFHNQRLHVTLEADSFEMLGKFNNHLQKQLHQHALHVHQAKAVSSGDDVHAEFEISEAKR